MEDLMEWQLCPTQRCEDKFLTVLHYPGTVTDRADGVFFESHNPIFCRLDKDITFRQLKEKAERKVCQEGEWRKEISRIRYRKCCCGDDGTLRYSTMEIRSDDDVRTMLEHHRNVPSRRQIIELFVETMRTPEEIIYLLEQRLPNNH